jgi:DNA replication protein DnaC
MEPATRNDEVTSHQSQQRYDLRKHRHHESKPWITTGVGKSHLACSLAVAACHSGYSVLYATLDNLVRRLRAADTAGRLPSQLKAYSRPALLVIDEIGYLPLDRADANRAFQLISQRYEKGSIIITSNKAFSEWGQVFTDEVLATAVLDRLLHHCEVISINGPSWRLKDRLADLTPATQTNLTQ